jgi:hypothetical protein
VCVLRLFVFYHFGWKVFNFSRTSGLREGRGGVNDIRTMPDRRGEGV